MRTIFFSLTLTVDCIEAQKKLHKMVVAESVLNVVDNTTSNANELLMPEILSADMSVSLHGFLTPAIRRNVVRFHSYRLMFS